MVTRELIARRPRLGKNESIFILCGVITFGAVFFALAYVSGDTSTYLFIIGKYALLWMCVVGAYIFFRSRLLDQIKFQFDDEFLYVSKHGAKPTRFSWQCLTRIRLPGYRGLELGFGLETIVVPIRYYENSGAFLRHLGEVAPATSHAVVHVACIGSGEFLRAYKGTKELK